MGDLSLKEYASIMGINCETARKQFAAGLPGAYRIHGTGPWRIKREAVDAMRDAGGTTRAKTGPNVQRIDASA